MTIPAVSTVFVVLLTTGSYDDRYSRVVRTFTNRADAERYVGRRNEDIARVEGMMSAVRAMVDAWCEANPEPESTYYIDSPLRAPHEEWCDKRWAEQKRLESVIGVEKAYTDAKLDPSYFGEDMHFWFQESNLDGDPTDY